jgi:four helix bundle protein
MSLVSRSLQRGAVLDRVKAKRPAAVAPLRFASLDPVCARRRGGLCFRCEGRRRTAMLRIYEVILDVVKALGPVMREVERRDPDLARQMRRAASSVALNTSEGMYSRGKNRGARYHTALGSMRETLACIEVSQALGYLEEVDGRILDSIGRIMATLTKLTA